MVKETPSLKACLEKKIQQIFLAPLYVYLVCVRKTFVGFFLGAELLNISVCQNVRQETFYLKNHVTFYISDHINYAGMFLETSYFDRI